MRTSSETHVAHDYRAGARKSSSGLSRATHEPTRRPFGLGDARPASRAIEHLGILAAYSLLAIVLTYPVVLTARQSIPLDPQIDSWFPGGQVDHLGTGLLWSGRSWNALSSRLARVLHDMIRMMTVHFGLALALCLLFVAASAPAQPIDAHARLSERKASAVSRGCRWLASQPSPDGSLTFPGQHLNVNVWETALALVALLRCDASAYGGVIARGFAFLDSVVVQDAEKREDLSVTSLAIVLCSQPGGTVSTQGLGPRAR